MRWDTLEEETCSLARTVAVIGDRWSLLILRECFLRTRRFEEFQSRLGITRHLLADRLKKFVRYGVLRRSPLSGQPGALRIHPDAARPRPVSGGDVDRALGRHAHGGRARPPAAAPAQELRKDVRPGDGLLRMRRAASRQGSARAQRTRRCDISRARRVAPPIDVGRAFPDRMSPEAG